MEVQIINIAFHLISFLLAILAASLLIWVNKEQIHSNRLLAFVLVAFSFQNLVLILLFSRLILEVPWMLRVFAPTTFLIGPAIYIYIRSVLYLELKFRKYDWLLLIPALLTILNFIPFYLMPNQEKIEFLKKNYFSNFKNPDTGTGLIPTFVFNILRVSWGSVFIIFGFRLIYLFRRNNPPDLVAKNKTLLDWLFTFNCLLTGISLVVLLKAFIPPIKNTQITVSDIVLGASILFIGVQLFLRPQILYGIYNPLPKSEVILNETGSNVAFNRVPEPPLIITSETPTLNPEFAEQYRYKKIIETHFKDKQPYLQPFYSLEQLVNDLNIPRYILSAFINREYGMGFREYLNRFRVDYFKENCTNPKWSQYTLEAMAEKCGFANRTTFIKNFKEITGTTPSEFIKSSKKVA